MAGTIDAKLQELGITLPEAMAPAANYVPFVRTGSLLYVSGQISAMDGKPLTGKLGIDVTLEEGQNRARICALNLIAQIKAALDGDLDRVVRVVKLMSFVASGPGFHDQHIVTNGASNLFAEVFGEAGKHARSAFGVAVLPLDCSVEVEAIVEVS